ncbi:hypothetical protein Tchar_02146 [Tepidimonas charontis]|uniref:Uncharacterized protein n=1 Tax=Tepidimonas charontis TaxID=2267262 RepID=A0A554X8Q0_9BURK|nr:hypothetical protein Tchar_02146 [Tepidimonas charontis]
MLYATLDYSKTDFTVVQFNTYASARPSRDKSRCAHLEHRRQVFSTRPKEELT